MDKNKMISLLMPLFFIIAGGFIIYTALEMAPEEGTFPLMIGVLTLSVAIVQFVLDVREKNPRNNFAGCNFPKVLEVSVSLILYIFLLHRVGYVIDTVLLAVYIMLTLGYKKYSVIFFSASFIVGAAFVIFKLFLRVPLPTPFFTF